MNKFLILLVLFCTNLFSVEWKYLESDAFKSRYVLAADFMKDMDLVVEIGGYKTPIVDFLQDDVAAISIDPLSQQRTFGNKRVVSKFYIDNSFLPKVNDYGVVLIGMHLEALSEEVWSNLLDLIAGAKKVIISYPICWDPSRIQHERICNAVPAMSLHKKILLDLEGNDFGDLEGSWPPRVKRMQYYYKKQI